MKAGVWITQSVLEYGGPPPLFPATDLVRSAKSASGLAHSKTWRPWLVCFCFLLSALCFRAWGQYSIDWSKIAGGGGTSTGAVYSVSGTIGQPDAGVMSGGQFTLHGGFWGIIAAVQTPGAPLLSIFRTTTNTVAVSWPAPAEGWVLEGTNALPSVAVASWPQVLLPYQTNAGTISVTFTNSPPVGNQFFRLHKP